MSNKQGRRVTVVVAVVSALAIVGGVVAHNNSKSPATATPPASGGYFQILPPGSAFPTEAQCAARVHLSTWEPRAVNNVPNHTTTPAGFQVGNFSQWNATWNSTYRPRINGNYTGTTDEIMQYEACKWGWSDEIIRAEAVSESNWNQATYSNGQPVKNEGFGDYSSTPSDCTYLFPTNPCPTSFGILQAKWLFHPNIRPSTAPGQAFPWTTKSTALAIDVQVAEMRGCYDGMSTFMGNTTGDLNGCLQSWFSGSYTKGGGSYSQGVQSHLSAKPWLQWADQGGGTVPSTTLGTQPPTTRVTVTTVAPTTVPVTPTTVKPTTTTTKPVTPTTTPATTPVTQPPSTHVLYACIQPNGYVQDVVPPAAGGVYIKTAPMSCPSGDTQVHWVTMP